MITLFTDTDTDITPEIAAEYGYHLISMPYTIDDQIIYPYEDFEHFDCHAFYDRLREGVLPTTSAISVEKYKEYFEPHFANGEEILYVHFSAAMTMTFENMDKAIEELSAKYPSAKFYTIDAKAITTLALAIVLEVGDLVKAGKSIEEILKWAETEVDKYTMYFFADDLKFFKRSGRVSGLAATMGTLLGVRPIIYMSSEGKMVSIGKEKGRSKAIDRLVQYVEELGEDVKDHRILIGHTDAPDIAQEAKEALVARFGEGLKIQFVEVNPTAGSHCGPNGVGIAFHAVHR